MWVTIAPIQIKAEYKEQFIKEIVDDARGSVNDEPGCMRFDVIQDANDPNRIWLYEVYRDEAAAQAHTQVPQRLILRSTGPQLWLALMPTGEIREYSRARAEGPPTSGPRITSGNSIRFCGPFELGRWTIRGRGPSALRRTLRIWLLSSPRPAEGWAGPSPRSSPERAPAWPFAPAPTLRVLSLE